MRKVFLLLALGVQALATPAHAESLSFSAQIEDEALAEEAILLVHCLSERTGVSWEFTGDTRGSRWLKAKEENRTLHISYSNPKELKQAILSAGGSERVCEALEPDGNPQPTLSLTPPQPSPLGGGAEREDFATFPRPKTWLWVGVGAAAVAAFFLWKSHQPDHRSIQMN